MRPRRSSLTFAGTGNRSVGGTLDQYRHLGVTLACLYVLHAAGYRDSGADIGTEQRGGAPLHEI